MNSGRKKGYSTETYLSRISFQLQEKGWGKLEGKQKGDHGKLLGSMGKYLKISNGREKEKGHYRNFRLDLQPGR